MTAVGKDRKIRIRGGDNARELRVFTPGGEELSVRGCRILFEAGQHTVAILEFLNPIVEIQSAGATKDENQR
jgi:hypothetical protein